MASFVICNSAYDGSALLELSAPDPHRQAASERELQTMSRVLPLRLLPTSACLAPPNHSQSSQCL